MRSDFSPRSCLTMSHAVLNSPEETMQFGRALAKSLSEGSVVCFEGDLAAGKTTLIKGLVSAYADYPEEKVNSPTFVLLNIYEGDRTVYHFDLYRLEDPDEFLIMGFDEMWGRGMTCVEWPERILPHLPICYIRVKLEHIGENQRRVTVDQVCDEKN